MSLLLKKFYCLATFICFTLVMSQSIPTGCILPGNPGGLAQRNCPEAWDLTFESCPEAGNSTRARILHMNS